MIEKSDKNELWLKAAVIGGLWASFEIILGSFLHNLRIPFSGTILASFGIMMLTAFMQIWKQNGIVWRAGIICALMKSISPSAVVFGPMVGIFLEAIIFYWGISLFGRNYFSYIFAGILSLQSTLAHKIINLTLLYGFDIIKIYINLIQFATKQIQFNVQVESILLFLVIIYVIFGIIAATLGIIVGANSLKILSNKSNELIDFKLIEAFSNAKQSKHYLLLLAVHMFAIPILLIIISNTSHYIFLPLTILYLAFCLFWYRASLKRLRKPLFWFQLFLIAFLSSFFIESFKNNHLFFQMQGFFIGLKMVLRAMVVVVGFSAFGIELRNPLVKFFLEKKGFKNLYSSLNLAFSILPMLISSLPKPIMFFKKPLQTFSSLVIIANDWYMKLK